MFLLTAERTIAVECGGDLTTKFAIEKRQKEKELLCRIANSQIKSDANITEVETAWKEFENLNDEYAKMLSDCISGHRMKRDKDSGCGCGMDPPRNLDERRHRRRPCGCRQYGHHHMMHDEFENRGNDQENETDFESRHHQRGMHHGEMHRGGMYHGEMRRGGMHHGEMRRGGMHHGEMHRGGMNHEGMHRGGMQHEGMHSVPHEDHESKTNETETYENEKKEKTVNESMDLENSMKIQEKKRISRHDTGSNDDPKDPEEMLDAHDRSKDFLRLRRSLCLNEASDEMNRLEQKYQKVCGVANACDRRKLLEESEEATRVSKKRQEAYREYLSAFNKNFGELIS